MPRWLAPDEADNGDIVVLRDLTNFALGDPSQVEDYDVSAIERNEHLPRRDVRRPSLSPCPRRHRIPAIYMPRKASPRNDLSHLVGRAHLLATSPWDVGLPIMDGYEVARLIRRHPGMTMRLIALTGYGQPEDRRRALEAGFDDHVVKPIDPARLSETLDAVARD
jgi:CheY-like chemotaxis protein